MTSSSTPITLYSTQVCPYCRMAERLLHQRGVHFISTIFIDRDPTARETMIARTGRRTVPQIYIGERHVGGYDDLRALDQSGELASLLHPSDVQ